MRSSRINFFFLKHLYINRGCGEIIHRAPEREQETGNEKITRDTERQVWTVRCSIMGAGEERKPILEMQGVESNPGYTIRVVNQGPRKR